MGFNEYLVPRQWDLGIHKSNSPIHENLRKQIPRSNTVKSSTKYIPRLYKREFED